VVGQDHVVRTLRNAVAAGSPAHAYLFAGPRGTGKTSMARILFRAVSCAQPREGDPCGECQACQAALQGRTLDLVEIDAASNRGIDDIRELREKVAFSPSEMRYRVYIVDEAHELTGPAWDAFLKTLEEPPPHAIFVLATTEVHKVPSTIVSRCQRFDFRRITPAAITARLLDIARREAIQVGPTAAERLARMARGGMRDAISLLDQAASFNAGRVDLDSLREVLGMSDPRTVQDMLGALARRDAAAALGQFVEVAESGSDLRLFAEELGSQLRGLLYAGAGASRALAADFSADQLAWLEREAELWEPAALKRLLQAIGDGLARIRDGGQFQLHLELALMEACGPLEAATAVVETAVPAEPPSASLGSTPTTSTRTRASTGRAERSESSSSSSAQAQPEPAALLEPGGSNDQSAGRSAAYAALLPHAPERLSLEAIRECWPRVIERVADHNRFVANYLQPAELRELQDDCLVLGLAFRVHHQRVGETKNLALVELACQQVLGQPLRVRCEHVQLSAGGVPDDLDLDDPVLKFALERFGGQVEVLED
jgi:DNA polymerase-3 subunit gamma/tau